MTGLPRMDKTAGETMTTANFGMTTVGGSANPQGPNAAWASLASPSSGGTLQTITVFVNTEGASATLGVAIYDTAGTGGEPGNCLSFASLTGNYNGWVVIPVPSYTLVSGASYWLEFANFGPSSVIINCTNGVGSSFGCGASSFVPDPNGWTFAATLSIYATYTVAVTGSPPTNTGLPVISGTPQVGQVLTSTTGVWTNSPTNFTFQWYNGAAQIAGATGSNYTCQTSDIGGALTVAVKATNAYGTSAPVNSAATTPVIPISSGGSNPINVFYVATTGNDSTGVGTASNPWATVAHAASTVTAGATVVVLPGTYTGQVIPVNSGTAVAPITYQSMVPGRAILDGTGTPAGANQYGILQLTGLSYLNFYGFAFTNAPSQAIILVGCSAINIGFNTFDSGFCTQTQGGIISNWNAASVAETSINIFNNYINNSSAANFCHSIEVANSGYCNVCNNTIAGSGKGDGIVLKNGGAYVNVFDNLIFGLYFAPYNTAACMDIDPSMGAGGNFGTVFSNFQIYGNTMSAPSGDPNGTIVYGIEGTSSTIQNGTIHDNIWQAVIPTPPNGVVVTNVTVSNNTVV